MTEVVFHFPSIDKRTPQTFYNSPPRVGEWVMFDLGGVDPYLDHVFTVQSVTSMYETRGLRRYDVILTRKGVA